MTPGWKLATLISGTGTPTSKDRELHFLRKTCFHIGMLSMRVAVPRSPAAASAARSLHRSAMSSQ